MFGVALRVVLMIVTPPIWIDAFTVTLCVAIILLSIVVLTGYTGQLSLAQYAIAGFGAWVAGRLIATQDIPFWLGLLIGVAATVPLGVLFALPAVRTRGINLAIVTLGLGTAIELMLFNNPDYTGGIAGTQVGDPTSSAGTSTPRRTRRATGSSLSAACSSRRWSSATSGAAASGAG